MLVAAACLLARAAHRRIAPDPPPLVIIDPGHGGEDPGAVHGGVAEATLSYRMAAELAAVLRARGIAVTFTVESAALPETLHPARPEPPLIPPRDARFALDRQPVRRREADAPDDLYRRSAIARQAGPNGRARAFVSLHFDAAPVPKSHGGHVCSDERTASVPALALALARRMEAAGFGGARTGSLDRRPLGVLNPEHNPVPEAVLVELATLSNDDDRAAALDAAWRWRAATLIADALAEVGIIGKSPAP